MTNRQFLWGLANGVMVLAIAGAFWLGLGIGMFASQIGGLACAALTAFQVAGCGVLLWGAIRLRRRAGFHRSELRLGDGRARLETRHVVAVIRWTTGLQALATAGAVWWCVRAHADRFIWPSIGMIVSLHLIPLARVFHVRAYYVTAVAGTAVSLVAVAFLPRAYALLGLATGMAAVMWISAAYLLTNAAGVAERALRDEWAV